MLTTSIKKGLLSGLKSYWFLIKIIIPVYLFITILKHTPVMDALISAFTPLMSIFRLPGEAAVPLITGLIIDEYGIIAAVKAVELTGYAVTVVIMMTVFSHSLFVEGVIIKKLGLSVTFFTTYRLIISIITGFVLSYAGVVFGLW